MNMLCNITSVMEFQRGWVLICYIFDQELCPDFVKPIFINIFVKYFLGVWLFLTKILLFMSHNLRNSTTKLILNYTATLKKLLFPRLCCVAIAMPHLQRSTIWLNIWPNIITKKKIWATTEMVPYHIWAPDFFGPQEIWCLRNFGPDKFSPRTKLII